MHLPPRGSPWSDWQPFRKGGGRRSSAPQCPPGPVSSEGGGDKTRCLRGEFWCLPRVEVLVAGLELAGVQADRPLPLAGSKSQACLPLGPKERGEGGERGLVFRAEEMHPRTGKG